MGTEPLRTTSIALRDNLFELSEFKARHDHDLHELTAIVRRREAESRRITDAIHLLRDLEATLRTLLSPVKAGVASSNGGGTASSNGVAVGTPTEVGTRGCAMITAVGRNGNGRAEHAADDAAHAPRGEADLVERFTTLLKSGDSSGVTNAFVGARLQELEHATPPPGPSAVWGFMSAIGAIVSGSMCLLALLAVVFLATFAPEDGRRYFMLVGAVGNFLMFVLSVRLRREYEHRRDALLDAVPSGEGGRIRKVLRELRAVHSEAAENVRAKNGYGEEVIRHATTLQRLDIERAKLDRLLSDATRAEQVAAAAHLTTLAEEELKLRAAEIDEVVKQRSSVEIQRACSNAGREVAKAKAVAAEEVAAAKADAATAVLRAQREAALARGKTRTAVAAAREMTKQAADADRSLQTLRETYDAKVSRNQELEGVVDELRRTIIGLRREFAAMQDPAVARDRVRQLEVQEQTHRVRLEQLGAEAAEHRAKARGFGQAKETDIQRFAREGRERFQRTADKQDVYEQLKRQCDGRLAQIAQNDGEASEAYQDAEAAFSVMLNELRQEVNE